MNEYERALMRHATTMLPPAGESAADVLDTLRKKFVELEMQNRKLEALVTRLSCENGDLCDRLFEMEQGLVLRPTRIEGVKNR